MLGLGLVGCFAPVAHAQLQPGRFYVTPQFGPVLPLGELLRKGAIYSTGRVQDPDNPVITDIKLDPGLLAGARFGYALTSRLAVEAELNWSVGVCVIRQLEIKPDADEGDEPQYETTTLDADIMLYGLNLSYAVGGWSKLQPMVNIGVGEHVMNLRRKGEVDPDPIRDRYVAAGVGVAIHATRRLTIRADVRDVMYNFRFDNQFIDPVESRRVLFRREEFINTTAPAGEKFQNDLAITVGFAVQTF